jgi:ubiquinone/menaquinone biosynthesis C-methylase UbiE
MQFDEQANSYDKRTGLGNQTAQKIATSVNHLIQPYPNGMLLEIGAGTGEIGFFLQNLSLPYAGMDLSKSMLDIYRQRFQKPEKAPELIQTDGNSPWPFPKNSVSVFFSSRAMHQLDHQHVLNQLKYLSSTNASLLILGNVKRKTNASKDIMRKEMHKILNDAGLKEKSGQSNRRILFEAIEQQGGERLPTIIASRWKVSHAPIESIRSWNKVDGIAGQEINTRLKSEILESLTDKANTLFTDINTPLETEETYELNAIKLPYSE